MSGSRYRLRTNRKMARDTGGRFTGLSDLAKSREIEWQLNVDKKLTNRIVEIRRKLEKTAHKSLRGGMYAVSQFAKASIVGSKRPSRPGQPPHTKGLPGKNLRKAIWYSLDLEKEEAFIGPLASKVGDVGALHEKGGDRPSTPQREDYPARPFMVPALERAKARFIGDWRGALA